LETVVDRRQFLRHLIAFGAVVSLPVSTIDAASAAEVEDAFKQLDDRPIWFSVDSYNTIRDPDEDEPEYRWQVFPHIDPQRLTSIDHVLKLADSSSIWRHFLARTMAAQEEAEAALDGRLRPGERRRIKKIAKALADPDAGVEHWIRMEGRANLPRLRAVVAEWLAEPIDWDEFDYFDAGGTPMGAAKAFFEELDQETLRALKIKIVDGDRPGSSYYAAELHMDLHAANTKAQAMGMPFRFRAADE
jgi:hypothetical protein